MNTYSQNITAIQDGVFSFMAQPCRQEREWNQRHQEILESAAPLLLLHGYSGTTMQMIAEKAEFSVGYIYKHFPGKKELMFEIIDQHLSLYENLRAVLTNRYPDEPLRAIRETMRQATILLQDSSHMLPLFLSHDSPGLERIRKRFEWARKSDAELMQKAIDKGQLMPCDPYLLAAAVDGAFLSLIRNFMENDELQRVIEIPQLLEDFILTPLTCDSSDRHQGVERKENP